jgi:hypothetical protein
MRRKYMELDSYTCDLCILQRNRGISLPSLQFRQSLLELASSNLRFHWNNPTNFQETQGEIGVPFFMEIIILMARSIWLTRNDWTFNNLTHQ